MPEPTAPTAAERDAAAAVGTQGARIPAELSWALINGGGELIPAHIIHIFGEGSYRTVADVWPYHAKRDGGTVPLNHVLRFSTYGHRVRLRQAVAAAYDVRVVRTAGADGTLDRAHLHIVCDLYDQAQPDLKLARGEFWQALTRPFAPPGRRAVRTLPPDLDGFPHADYEASDLVAEPPEAYRIAGAQGGMGTRWVFQPDRTDGYRHFNTVVYLELAQDMLAQAFSDAHKPVARMAVRDMIVHFRKPFLAGERAAVDVGWRDDGDSFAAAVRLYHEVDGRPSARPSTALKLYGSWLA